MNSVERISSPSNALLVRLRRLLHDGASYRRHGLVWIEGEHLCQAAVRRDVSVQRVLFSQRGWARPALHALVQGLNPLPPVALLDDALFAQHSTLESPGDVAFVLDVPAAGAVESNVSTVLLDRLQDAGNVGSILRSAAALGVTQVLALKGTVALWSPKVLRAGMGAHFALHLVEGIEGPHASELASLTPAWLATSSHAEQSLLEAPLPEPCVWVLGHEGQGVSEALLARCANKLRIPQPGGEESLNVAAAAAICFYESLRRRLTIAGRPQ